MSVAGFPEILALLLAERGVSLEEKESFLNPEYSSLHNPLHLPNMERARDRVLQAINNGEHITVYSDYDADGIPGAVVMSDFFRRIGYENISFYIPHRHDEGFGLNVDAIQDIATRGTKLLITIDCGISDVAEVALANTLGIEVIITDHHEPGDNLPQAFAIVNPKLKESQYPFKELCGSAVAYKLVQAIYEKESFNVKPGMEKWSLDMVGIATLSDMVPLVGENRVLARFGLEVLKKSPRPGMRALLRRLKIDPQYLTEDDVGFMITPRINAASRMGVPKDAFDLLSTESELEAERLAKHLEEINQERKGVVGGMVKQAKHELALRENIPAVIVIGNPEWKPSLLGLVANSLVEVYERPVFAFGRDGDGVLKGSCRSYNGFNLYELMKLTGDSYLQYGGHKGAGGFSISLEQLTTLETKLSLALEQLTSDIEEVNGGLSIQLSDVSEGLWRTVSQFAPFGMGNEKPVFKLTNIPIRSMKQFGKAQEHLELELGSGLKAISFFSSPQSYKVESGISSCTLYAHLEKSYFRYRPEIRLRIVNIEP